MVSRIVWFQYSPYNNNQSVPWGTNQVPIHYSFAIIAKLLHFDQVCNYEHNYITVSILLKLSQQSYLLLQTEGERRKRERRRMTFDVGLLDNFICIDMGGIIVAIVGG